MDWEFGVNRCKLLHLEWISNEILLYSTVNYIQSFVRDDQFRILKGRRAHTYIPAEAKKQRESESWLSWEQSLNYLTLGKLGEVYMKINSFPSFFRDPVPSLRAQQNFLQVEGVSVLYYTKIMSCSFSDPIVWRESSLGQLVLLLYFLFILKITVDLQCFVNFCCITK